MAAYLLRTSPYEVWYRVVFNVFSTLQNCKITDEKIFRSSFSQYARKRFFIRLSLPDI